MKYTVNKVFTEEECEQILTTCMKEGERFYYTEEEANSWDCRRIHQKAFKEYILEKLNINHTFGTLKIKDIIISLTKYIILNFVLFYSFFY